MLGFKKKRNLASVQASFSIETNLNVIENKNVHRNYQPDSYLLCRLFAPLQQCERSWSMFSYFYTSMMGLFIDMELRNIYSSAGFAFQSSGKSAPCDCWTLCFDLFRVSSWTVEGKIRVWTRFGQRFSNEMWSASSAGHLCESSRLWLLAGSKGAFQAQVKANGLWAVSSARWSHPMAAFDSPTLVWCCSSLWGT